MRLIRSPHIAAILTAPALLLAGCSAEKTADSTAAASDAAPPGGGASAADASSDKTGPAIAGAVARGVAFTYSYDFTLPAKAISAAQQHHAEACRALGPDRCRVTAMHYEQPREGEVAAELDFLLAPDLAHGFANDAVAAVEKAAGKLERAEVNGENAGDAIKLSQSDSAGIEAEAKRIETRLAGPGLGKGERAELERQLAELRGQLRTKTHDRQQLERAIATTPVAFRYSSEGLLSGNSGTFSKAASASWSSAQSALTLVMVIGGIALPWLALAALATLLWRSPDLRRLLRRLFGRGGAIPPASL